MQIQLMILRFSLQVGLVALYLGLQIRLPQLSLRCRILRFGLVLLLPRLIARGLVALRNYTGLSERVGQRFVAQVFAL